MNAEQPAVNTSVVRASGEAPPAERPSRVAGPSRDAQCSWQVDIALHSHLVVRKAKYVNGDGVIVGTEEQEIIWPTWPATPADNAAVARAPLDDLEQYWRTTGNRLRESAKWMATVLGLALATIVGTSPLAYFTHHRLDPAAAAIGFAGLSFLGITMILVLRVMQPQAVTYAALETAERPNPIHRWRQSIEANPDLYLPCGVTSLESLRRDMALEEATLVELVRLEETIPDETVTTTLHLAQIARSARLFELRKTAASIGLVAEYYALRARSTEAMYGGAAALADNRRPRVRIPPSRLIAGL
jgi:hypothetical protein